MKIGINNRMTLQEIWWNRKDYEWFRSVTLKNNRIERIDSILGTKKGATRYNNKHGSTQEQGIYIKNPQKSSHHHVITHKRHSGWGTPNFYKKYASQSEMVSPSMPPTIGI